MTMAMKRALMECLCRCGLPTIYTPIYRYIRVVGQQASEGVGEDTNWIATGNQYPWAEGFACKIDFAGAPTTTISGVPHWIRKMYPMRYKIDSFGDGFWGGFSQAPAASGPVNDLERRRVVGISSTTLGPNSHLWPMTVDQMSFPYPFKFNWRASSGNSETRVHTTHYRILIDGIDVTGVVEYPLPIEFLANMTPVFGSFLRHGEWSDLLDIPPSFYESKSVHIDYWITVDSTGPFTNIQNSECCWTEFSGFFRKAEFRSGDTNANRRSGDKYLFTFSNNGPEGVSSIVGESQSGWTFTDFGAGFTLTKTDALFFSWGAETPEIIVGLQSKLNSPSGSGKLMRYSPADSGDYDPIRFGNGLALRQGVWDPQGATVFNAVGREINSAPTHWLTKGSFANTGNQFADFPDTITVQKV